MTLTTVAITIALGVTTAKDSLPVGFADLFEEHEYRCNGGKFQNDLFHYRLFVPRNVKAGEQYPLLVWLHGYGESGSDNQWNLKFLSSIIDTANPIEQYRFFVLSVQCPLSDPTWFHGHRVGSDDMLTVTYDILQETLRDRPIDQDRVYLAGVSLGGTGCWEMALRYPDLFAAVAPMGSDGGDMSRAATLRMPIWAYHCRYDRPEGVQKIVFAVQEAGGNAYLTLLPWREHGGWPVAFRQDDIMGWMLAQRRGAWICWTPPGCRPWRWWHVLTVPTVFGALVWWGWRSERNRRCRLLLAASCTESASENGDRHRK